MTSNGYLKAHYPVFFEQNRAKQGKPGFLDEEVSRLIRETHKGIDFSDKNAAIDAMADILNTPGMAPTQYQLAFKCLDQLLAFSAAYLDLYGTELRVAS